MTTTGPFDSVQILFECYNMPQILFECHNLPNLDRSFAVSEGAIESVIAVTDRAESMTISSKIQILGLALMMSFSYTAENQATIVKNNGIRTILKVLSSSSSCERIHEYGFRLLWLFAQDPSHHDLIIEQGVIPTAIAGMAAHRRRAGIQEHGCGLIRSLCFKVRLCDDLCGSCVCHLTMGLPRPAPEQGAHHRGGRHRRGCQGHGGARGPHRGPGARVGGSAAHERVRRDRQDAQGSQGAAARAGAVTASGATPVRIPRPEDRPRRS